ncbi:acyl-CoA dehydrogenase family protein [Streptomyces spongiae]|uniref:Acyl-CoA dehydrogenase n=1 Tax=Streptomyces spongiae TaxID=565072 RepID=A0A5N8XDK1_9ACTN|nr:acyl-CoA dehydrogenase family protein [Streptomyces spongiae]MPY57522.1 acyl-CoA dehydrogenase [Streptomyces spongiae]
MEKADALVSLLAENAAKVDAEAEFPVENLCALRESGYLGLLVPTEYGGMGRGLDDMVEVARSLSTGCLSTAMIWAMHCQQTDVLVRHADAGLRAELLPRVAAGEVYLASITTDTNKGGHLLAAQDSLAHRGELLTLHRDAPVVTGGVHADGFLITMRAHQEAREHEVTLVYANRKDLSVQQTHEWRTLGMRGTHSVGLRLSGQVPAHHIVGAPGRFREVAADSMVPTGHLGWSACWLGAAQGAFSRLVRKLAASAHKGGTDLSSPLVQERVARIRLDLELVSAYLSKVREEVSALRESGRRLDAPSVQIHLNTLKLAASELTFQAADRMVQLAGLSTGYSGDSPIPLERVFRDLRSAALNYANDRLLTANGALSMLDRAVTLV